MNGRPRLYTAETFDKIRGLVAKDVRREQIAELIGTTVNSLQVRCSQHRISLRCPTPRKRVMTMTPEEKLARLDRLFRNEEVRLERKIERSLSARKPALQIEMDKDTLVLLTMRAEKKGTTATAVAKALLETIARDNLWDAVIDEAA